MKSISKTGIPGVESKFEIVPHIFLINWKYLCDYLQCSCWLLHMRNITRGAVEKQASGSGFFPTSVAFCKPNKERQAIN